MGKEYKVKIVEELGIDVVKQTVVNLNEDELDDSVSIYYQVRDLWGNTRRGNYWTRTFNRRRVFGSSKARNETISKGI